VAVKVVMADLWKREQYNGVGPDYENYREGATWDMGGRVEKYEAQAVRIVDAILALRPASTPRSAMEGADDLADRLEAEVTKDMAAFGSRTDLGDLALEAVEALRAPRSEAPELAGEAEPVAYAIY